MNLIYVVSYLSAASMACAALGLLSITIAFVAWVWDGGNRPYRAMIGGFALCVAAAGLNAAMTNLLTFLTLVML